MQEQKIGTILWRGKWLMLISLVVCVALAVFITKTSAKMYAASAIIQVNAPSQTTTDTFQNQQASQDYPTRTEGRRDVMEMID